MWDLILWFLVVTVGFALLNGLWAWLFVRVEMSRLATAKRPPAEPPLADRWAA